MAVPQGPILGAVHLDDGVNSKFDWQRAAGLSDTSQVMPGSIQATFDGPFRVAPRRQTRPQRDVLLTGYLTHSGGLAEGWSRLTSVQQLVSTPLATLQVGRLGLDVVPQSIRPERFKATLGATLDYVTSVTAVPGTWRALYGAATGGTYGMTANAESLINTSAFALAAGASPAVTNLGTAPTPLVLTISVSGPRTTRFYVRCTAPGYTRRISVTPLASGKATITEDMGLFVPPGSSTLRYEEASGALITGTIASSIYGTRWRWDGLPLAESTASPAILYNTRQQRAYAATSAFTTSAGLTLYGPDVPRFGNSGTFDAADAGLVVEPDRTNLVLQSQALGTTWTQAGMVTVTNNNSTAPDGTTTSTRVLLTAGMAGSVSQSITLTNAPYVISFYARGTGSFTVAMGAILSAQVVTPGTNWTRYQYLVAGTAAAYSLTFADNAMAAADVQLWGVQVELATGQTAANATSYIPTTSTTQRRYADVVGVRPVENLLAYSNRFDKTTGTSTTRGLWYVAGGTVTTATLQAGPSGVTDAATMTAAGAVAGIQQRLLNAEHLAGKTVQFSVWVRNSVSTPDSDALLRIEEFGTGAGTTDGQLANVIDQWTRISVQRKLSAGVTDVSLQIRSSGTITYYFAHAQAVAITDGTYNLASSHTAAVSCPYIETQATPVQAQAGWRWPDWLTQNGYIEADVCLAETANPNSVNRTILGAQQATYSASLFSGWIARDSSYASGVNTILYAKHHNGAGAFVYDGYTPSASVFDAVYRKWRLEWVNYLIGSTRTIQLRIYIDGVLVDSTAPTATAWLRPASLEIYNQANSAAFLTAKNIAIGSPVLPANAVPEPY